MNPKIKELAERADAFDDAMDVGGKSYIGLRDEYFAKLIVQECATICDTIGKEARKQWKTKYIPHDDGRCDGAWECEAAILEHFGVNDES